MQSRARVLLRELDSSPILERQFLLAWGPYCPIVITRMESKNTEPGPVAQPITHNGPANPTSHSNPSEIACNIETRVTESRYAVFSNISSSIIPSLRWRPTSEQDLQQAESGLLAVLTRPFKGYFVDIGPGWNEEKNNIRTLEMLTDHEIKNPTLKNDDPALSKQPIVMIHGFGAGIGTWILNLDTLASKLDRKVYAFDILGFGRSSRPNFDLNGDVEGQFVESIESWRQKQGIEKFIILGHSFGGYLSAGYALRYPNRVSHVIMADPWGVQDRQTANPTYRFPIWVRVVNSFFQAFNPLAVLRVTGPYGPRLVQKFRGDLREKFRPVLQDDCHKFLTYIYHCNAQRASGESAFKALALPFGWPKFPLVNRLVDLDEAVSLTFIYGSRSWIQKTPGEFLRECLTPGRVTVNVIQGSGHHVYADKYTEFNEMVLEACSKVSS